MNWILDESVHESFFMAIGVEPLLYFLTALCVAPALLGLYKNRVTALMSTRAEGSVEHPDLIGTEKTRQSNQNVSVLAHGHGTREAVWTEAARRKERFDKHVIQTAVVHLGLLLVAMIAGNLHDLTDSWLQNSVGIAAYGLFLALLGTPVLASIGVAAKPILTLWGLSVPVFAVALYWESGTDPSLQSIDTYWTLGFLVVLMWALYFGMAGTQLRKIVPYLTVAMSVSGLLMHVLYQFYSVSACVFNAQTSELDYLLIALIIFVAGVLLTLWFIRVIAEKYEHKRLSDSQIQMSCWLIFTTIVALLVFQVDDEESVALRLAAVPAPLICLFSLWFFLRKSVSASTAVGAQRLLLLRVFSTDKRGEKWLSKVERFWRHIGPVYLIAGPDLAKTGIDPHELYRFLTRNIKSLFIGTDRQVNAHLDAVDNHADPDGRFRINEFFCLDDTWEQVAQGLIKRSDVVVLDVRDFELSRLGTAKEIAFLAKAAAFSRTLLLVSDETSVDDLISVIEELTGLRISADQFLVTVDTSAQYTVSRMLDLREQNLQSQYRSTEPSMQAFLSDDSLQQAAREETRQKLVLTHEQTRYGVDYLVLAFGLAGLFSFAIQLLAPLYLLLRRVPIRKGLLLVLATVTAAACFHVLSLYLPITANMQASENQYFIAALILLVFSLLWAGIWYFLSRKAKRWIAESQEPLRTALKQQ